MTMGEWSLIGNKPPLMWSKNALWSELCVLIQHISTCAAQPAETRVQSIINDKGGRFQDFVTFLSSSQPDICTCVQYGGIITKKPVSVSPGETG